MERIGNWRWYEFASLESTNDKAKEMSEDAPADEFVVTAVKQTKGRGRRGREWLSLDGNLFMSLGLTCELRYLGQLIFVVSLSLLEAIKKLGPDLDVKLKWPNDVLVNGKKISGILLEKGEKEYIIVGIGVNIKVAPSRDEGLIYPATSLQDVGISTDRLDFLKVFIQVFDSNLAIWQNEGFAKLRSTWLQYAKGLGEEIMVKLENEPKNGIFNGVDDNGMLLLKTKTGIEKIYAGDVFYKEENK